MKNLSIKSVAMLAAATISIMCTQSCQKRPEPLPTGSKIEVSVAIEGQDSTPATAPSSVSKAGTGEASKNKFVNGDSFGMWVVPYLNSESGKEAAGELRDAHNYVDNALYSLTAGTWTTAAQVFYPNDVTLVDLYAVTPYDVNMSATSKNTMDNPKAYAFDIKSDQTTTANVIASDLMTAKTEKAISGSTPVLTFQHRMSKVLLNFTLNAKYKEKDITKVQSVLVCGIPLKATVDVTNPTVAAVAATGTNIATDIKAYMTKAPDAPVIQGDYTYEAIVTPGTKIEAGLSIARITLTIGSGANAEDVAFDCKVSSAHTYANGQYTTINVSIEDQTTITLNTSDITIASWIDQTDPEISTVKPAMMIFAVTGTGVATKCPTIKTAKLTLESVVYTADVVYNKLDAQLKCTYRIPSTLFPEELTAVSFHNEAGNEVGNLEIVSSDASKKMIIKKNPYDINNYTYVIATVTF